MAGQLGRVAAGRAAAGGSNEDYDGVDLRGFKLLDVSGLNAERSCEGDEEGSVVYGNSEVLFEIAMKRMVAGELPAAVWGFCCCLMLRCSGVLRVAP
jgi:hypothetical protein